MGAIRLRFVGTHDDLVSATIRRSELGFWASHVEAVTPAGLYLGAHMSGGVLARASDYDKATWTAQLFVNVPATDEQASSFYAFLDAQLGKAYDVGAIAELAKGFLTGDALAPDDRWICSGLQVAATLHAGIFKAAPRGVRTTTPCDLLHLCAAVVPIGVPEHRALAPPASPENLP